MLMQYIVRWCMGIICQLRKLSHTVCVRRWMNGT